VVRALTVADGAQPVTVTVARRVLPGDEHELEEWAERVAQDGAVPTRVSAGRPSTRGP
jgi:antibiotic biosynthesis monooxygenase (ABM) superfamily enzyme